MTSPSGDDSSLGSEFVSAGENGQHGEGAAGRIRLRTEAEIEDWFVSALSRELKIPPENIDLTAPFETFGLDSVAAVGLTGSLEDWLGCPVDPMVVYDYPTIEAMAKYWAERTRAAQQSS